MNLLEKRIESFNKHGSRGSKFLRKKSSVLMFSGGIDSVAGLKYLLVETDKLLYVHHIHLKSNEGFDYPRYKKEAEAVRKIVPYMKKTFRNFNYTESTIEVKQINQLKPDYYEEEDFPLIDLQFVPDQIYYYFMGGLLAKVSISDKIYIGTCIEDYAGMPSKNHCSYPHQSQRIQDAYALPERQLATSGIAKGSAWPHEISYHRPHDDNSKKENIEYIGKELMDMVWYCRQPTEKDGEFVVCHECRSCKHVDDALSEKE